MRSLASMVILSVIWLGLLPGTHSLAQQDPTVVGSIQNPPAPTLDPGLAFNPEVRDPSQIYQSISRLSTKELELLDEIDNLEKAERKFREAASELRRLELEIPPVSKEVTDAAIAALAAADVDGWPLSGDIPSIRKTIESAEGYIEELHKFNGRIFSWSQMISGGFGNQSGPTSEYSPRVFGSFGPPQIPPNAAYLCSNLPRLVAGSVAGNFSRIGEPDVEEPAQYAIQIRDCLSKLAQPPDIRSFISDIQSRIGEVVSSLTSQISFANAELNAVIAARAQWSGALRKVGDINDRLITYAIPAIGVLILLLLCVPKLYSEASQRDILKGGIILEVLTVFLLVASTLILGIADKIAPESLGTLLGGISGYVLGRSFGGRASGAPEEPEAATRP